MAGFQVIIEALDPTLDICAISKAQIELHWVDKSFGVHW